MAIKKDKVSLPLSSVWLTNSISEYKGKQELYAKQSPQVLKSLIEMALIESAENIKPSRGAKTAIVEQAILGQHGEFSISDIERACPNVSRPMIRVVLEGLRAKSKIEVLGTGRSAHWRKRDNKT